MPTPASGGRDAQIAVIAHPSQTSEDLGCEKELEATRADRADLSLGAGVRAPLAHWEQAGTRGHCSAGPLASRRPGLSSSGSGARRTTAPFKRRLEIRSCHHAPFLSDPISQPWAALPSRSLTRPPPSPEPRCQPEHPCQRRAGFPTPQVTPGLSPAAATSERSSR